MCGEQGMGRPAKRFHEFIGQRRVVGHLQRLIGGAKQCGDPCTSLLLVGAAGFGKTSIAQAVAAEYGSTFRCVLASGDTKPAEICAVLRDVRHGDVVLIDEAHALSRDAQQILYVALDEWRVPVETKRGISRSENESIAQFTLILATNEPGGVKQALRSRLTRIEFDSYTPADLKAIGEHVAQQREISLTPQAANLLAQVAQGSPRVIARRVQNLKHYWPDGRSITKDHVRTFLTSEGVDERGFTPHQRLYLRHLIAQPDHECNVERLALKLGCDAANVRQEIEPYLIEQGFVDPTSRQGRGLTEAGVELINNLRDPDCAEQEA